MEFMKADKALEADINKATSSEQIRDLLAAALERSTNLGVTRDAQTGQYIRREPSTTPAAKTTGTADEVTTRTETIAGRQMEFTGTALEIEKQITAANKVAEALKVPPIPAPAMAPRVKTQAEREREIYDRTQAELAFRRGELTTTEFLERTNAIGAYLAEKGFDVDAAAGQQLQQSWREATEDFLRSTPEGQSWPGGQKNLEIIGNLIQAHGLTDAADKVAALRALAAEMQSKGIMFDGDVTPDQVVEATSSATPQEILEAWKAKQGTPEEANSAFVSASFGRLFGF